MAAAAEDALARAGAVCAGIVTGGLALGAAVANAGTVLPAAAGLGLVAPQGDQAE